MTKLIYAFRNFFNAPNFQYLAYTVQLWASYDSKNKQALFHYTELTNSLEMKTRCI